MSELRMVRVPFDAVKLMALASRRGLSTRDTDLGYLAHCALEELFGPELAPKPFSLPTPTAGAGGGHGRVIPVLGYTTATADALREHAQTFADPGVHALCLWSELADKPMPARFEAGKRLGFTARVCPVVRRSKTGEHQEKSGAEIDAFLSACRRVAPDVEVSREGVYVDWLRMEFERRGGATLDAARMVRFERQVLARRGAPDAKGQRTAHRTERPDAQMEGTLTVTDAALFDAMLRRGLGRHRSFGFGMMLLRPPA